MSGNWGKRTRLQSPKLETRGDTSSYRRDRIIYQLYVGCCTDTTRSHQVPSFWPKHLPFPFTVGYLNFFTVVRLLCDHWSSIEPVPWAKWQSFWAWQASCSTPICTEVHTHPHRCAHSPKAANKNASSGAQEPMLHPAQLSINSRPNERTWLINPAEHEHKWAPTIRHSSLRVQKMPLMIIR